MSKISVSKYLLFAILTTLPACSIQEDPLHLQSRKAEILNHEGNFRKAQKIYEKISGSPIKGNELKLAVYLNISEFYLQNEKYAEVIDICNTALSVLDDIRDVFDPNNEFKSSFLFLEANAYEELGEYSKAEEIYKSMIADAEKVYNGTAMRKMLPLIKLGDIAIAKNDFKTAIEFYREAFYSTLLPNPLYRILNYRIAVCCVALGRTSEAENYFKNSLPLQNRAPGPAQLFDSYQGILKTNKKYGGLWLLKTQRTEWQKGHQHFLEWLSPRTANPAELDVLNDYTEKDFSKFMDRVSNKIGIGEQ